MKTKYIWFILFAWLFCNGAIAQETYPKSELRQVKKMLKRPSARCPLPEPLSTDERCASYVFGMKKNCEVYLRLTADSIEARMAENEFIRSRLPYVKVKKDLKVDFDVMADRERLRADCISREARYLKLLSDAAARPAPQGELLSLEYRWSGMANHPFLPFKLTKTEGDSALVEYGYQQIKVLLADSLRTGLEKIFRDERLYHLGPYYVWQRIDLPSFPRQQVLDGEHWSLDARFSDGTRISSSGDIPPDHELSALERYYDRVIVPEIQKKRQRVKP